MDDKKPVDATRCPDCGAPIPDGGTCRDYFDACLVKEFSDPAYGTVHNLTVLAYLLQHPGELSREGWAAMRKTLTDFVREQIPPDVYRRAHRGETENLRRDFRFAKGEKMTLPETLRWTTTAADIRLADAETYCADVRTWAEAVVTDLEAVLS